MRFLRSFPARCASTMRSCSNCTLNRPLGNFSTTVPVTSIQSSLLIVLQVRDSRTRLPPCVPTIQVYPKGFSALRRYTCSDEPGHHLPSKRHRRLEPPGGPARQGTR